MIYFVLIYSIIKLYLILAIYQQSHYSLKEYFKYFFRRFIYYDICILLASLAGKYTETMDVLIWCGLYIILFGILNNFLKVALKYSKRVIRLNFILIILCIGYMFIPYLNLYFLVMIEFTVIPILRIEKLITNYFNKRYLSQAKSKIKNYTGTIIGITGSFGKTSTKRLLEQSLSCYTTTIATPKSYNTLLGISSFLNDTPISSYSNLVIEYGASKKNDIQELKEFIFPNVGFITEIGFMHMDGFHTIENVVQEKMSLLDGCDIAVLNYDNEFIRTYPISNKVILTYGLNYGDYQARNIEGNSFDFYYKEKKLIEVKCPFVGTHQILNFTGVLAYLHYLSFDLNKIKNAVRTFKMEKNRLELKQHGSHFILDDSFNSNLKGFIEALKSLGKYKMIRILITPGLVELGQYQKEVYDELVVHIVANTTIVILVGIEETKVLYNRLKMYGIEVYVARDFKEAYKLYLCIIKNEKESIVLIENDLPDIYKRGLRF